ncbi:MAG: tetratricopeptide repeat protein [Nibricoccus sp.]
MKPTTTTTHGADPVDENGKRTWLFAALLAAAGIAAWSNSFNGPFVFDDVGTILNNPSLLKLLSWETLAGPPGGTTASGRPLVNLSLALNHALGGFNVRGYHVFNLALHLATALSLFGVVRRTFRREAFRPRLGFAADIVAFTCGALWLLHPLQTAAVTYIVQRAEVLASLFYLLTLYCFLRAIDSSKPLRWQSLSVASCLLGMASKEIIISAPLFVFLYDRTLVSGSIATAWRQRRGYYLALASTWFVLATLIVSTHGRGGSVGSSENITPWTYALTQCQAVAHYLRLSIWPAPLVFDYGTAAIDSMVHIWPQAALLLTLAGATSYAVCKNSPLGLAGAWFFAVLAPSSSFAPIVTQTMAEHRMYLPLAAVIVIPVVISVRYLGRRSIPVFIGAAVLFGLLTFRRNVDYRDAVTLWEDTVTKLPSSKRAYNNLGTALFIAGCNDEAIATFQHAVQLDPRYASALVNLGRAQLQSGQPAVAANNFATALAVEPANPEAHFGLGFALASTGRVAEGIPHYREAIRLQPTAIDYRLKLAQALFRAREPAAAINEFRELLRSAPKLVEAHSGLGTVLASQGQFAEAEKELTEALRLNPADFDAHLNLANAFAQQNRVAEAIPHYEAALRVRPDHAGAREILEQARAYLRSSP